MTQEAISHPQSLIRVKARVPDPSDSRKQCHDKRADKKYCVQGNQIAERCFPL
jgi:hypothetical protein